MRDGYVSSEIKLWRTVYVPETMPWEPGIEHAAVHSSQFQLPTLVGLRLDGRPLISVVRQRAAA